MVREGLTDLYPRLWRFCLALTGSRASADDLAQQSCLQALDKAESFQADSHLDRWIFTIARRVWLNDRRAQKVRVGTGVVDAQEAGLRDEKPGPETNFFTQQVLERMSALPDGQRETVLLVYVEGFSYREAAEALDIPIGTVMSRLSAARREMAGLREAEEVSS
ncbi:MAG: RNA polymerase sigma factor [Pseudomonadota bacterium]